MKQILLILFTLFFLSSNGQSKDDSLTIRNLFDEALTSDDAYENLRFLCKNIGARLSGSDASYQAIYWGENLMKTYGFDNVFLQEVMVPVWRRGQNERLNVDMLGDVNVLALGGSVNTNGILEGENRRIKEFQSST